MHPKLHRLSPEHAACTDPSTTRTGIEGALVEIVRTASTTQTLKGVLTAGIYKSTVYAGAKLGKMFQSNRKQ